MELLDLLRDENLKACVQVNTQTNKELLPLVDLVPTTSGVFAIEFRKAESMQTLTYEQFLERYEQLLTAMLKYTAEQVGRQHFADKVSDLVAEYPEFEARYDSELDARFSNDSNS